MEFTQITPLIFEATNSSFPVSITFIDGCDWLVKTTFDEYSGFDSFNDAVRFAETKVSFTASLSELNETLIARA